MIKTRRQLAQEAAEECFVETILLPRDHTPFKMLTLVFLAFALVSLAVALGVEIPKDQPLVEYSSTFVTAEQFVERKANSAEFEEFGCNSKRLTLLPSFAKLDLPPIPSCSGDARARAICYNTASQATKALYYLQFSGPVLDPSEIMDVISLSLDQVPKVAQIQLESQESPVYFTNTLAASTEAEKLVIDAEWLNISTTFYSPAGLVYFQEALAPIKDSVNVNMLNFTRYFETVGIQRCSWKERLPKSIKVFEIMNTWYTLFVPAGFALALVYFCVYTCCTGAAPV